MTTKEFGSDFHFVEGGEFRTLGTVSSFWRGVNFYFSGRSALRAILLHGISDLNWKKLYVPSYYCQEVYHFMKDLPIALEFYECIPFNDSPLPDIEDVAENVLMQVNYFGHTTAEPAHWKNVATIDDITHDVNRLHESTADYVFGSMRKELPVPVGGFVRTKTALPAPIYTDEAEAITLTKLCGMVLKQRYLEGQFDNKPVFREWLVMGEENFENRSAHGALPQLIQDYVFSLDVKTIKDAKKRNNRILQELLYTNSHFEVMSAGADQDFGLMLRFSERRTRNHFRDYLIQNSIYPAVLWPGQDTVEGQHTENVLLFIHSDFRYSEDDMTFISSVINEYKNDV